MRDTSLWLGVPVAALLLSLLAALSVSMDRGLAARAAGRGFRSGVTVPVTDTARLLLQRRRTTLAPDALLWRIGGGALLTVAALMVAVVPLGGYVLSDLPIGVVWFNAMDVLLWAVLWLAGWGTNSVYGLIGGYRFLSQAVSYELPLMFALVTPAVAAGSLRIADVVNAQSGLWFAAWMPLSLLVYLVAVLAFSLVGPFAYPVGADIAGGVLAEPSGVDRLMMLAGREALLVAGAAFAVPLFLGGGAGPVLPGWLWSLVKTMAVLALLTVVRRRIPTIRAERFAEVGWLVGLPLTLLQLLIVSVVVVARA